MFIKIATMFTNTPGGRYIAEGPYSGEEFRTKYLEPYYNLCLLNNEPLIIDFDGTYGYSVTFLEESFGGLVRLGYDYQDILERIEYISLEEPKIVPTIKQIIYDEGLRLSSKKRRKDYDKY